MSAIVDFAHRLQSTQFSIAIQSISWLMPLVQAIHIVMIGVVFVSLLVICLRVLGRVRMDESFDAVWARFAPWMWTGLAVMAATGLVMMAGEPVREATATSFWLKMGLILIAVAMVHVLRRNLAGSAAPRFAAGPRAMSVAIIAILVTIVFLGRAIAYDLEVWGLMDLNSFAQAVHASGVAEWMRSSLKAMPIVESIHVLCAALVFGTILIVDLRMLGYPNTQRSFTRIHHELIPVTWVAFVVSVITGALMFAPNSITYVGNTAFQLKLLAILAAGINMAIFQLLTARSVANWDQNARAPGGARLAGALSILLWIAVIFLARWIGFTKGYDFTVPTDVQFDFSK